MFPCGADVPNASNLNYAPGTSSPTPCSPRSAPAARSASTPRRNRHRHRHQRLRPGRVGSPSPVVPGRVLETRVGPTDGRWPVPGWWSRPAGSTLELTVAGRAGVPADASAVMLNVTAVNPSRQRLHHRVPVRHHHDRSPRTSTTAPATSSPTPCSPRSAPPARSASTRWPQPTSSSTPTATCHRSTIRSGSAAGHELLTCRISLGSSDRGSFDGRTTPANAPFCPYGADGSTAGSPRRLRRCAAILPPTLRVRRHQGKQPSL